jgi:hypothetical protein
MMTLNKSKYLIIFLAIVALAVIWKLHDNQDPQGGNNSNCTSVELPPVLNGTGMVVSSHNTVCDVMGGNSAIYVYIHKSDESENKDALVFRYFDKPGVNPPKIEWINKDSVRISVGKVSQITKQLNEINGIKITYEIGSVDYQ